MGKNLEIEKLKGAENYHTWSFAVKNVLNYRGYEKCIESAEAETNVEKLKKLQSNTGFKCRDESLCSHNKQSFSVRNMEYF